MTTWLEEPLSAVCRAVGGGTPSRQNPRFWHGEIAWASVKDFKAGQRYIERTEESITEAGLASSAARLIPAGTPLVCTRMAVGRCAIPLFDVAINQDVKALFPNGRVSGDYLQRLLQHHERELERIAIGSTVKGISTDQLLRLRVSYPSSPIEQSQIAIVLDCIDAAAYQTEVMLAKLKQIQTGLRCDLLTHGLDEQGNLRDPEVNPEQFKDSEVGFIPRHWNVCKLGQVLRERPKNGYSPIEASKFEGGFILGLGCLSQEGFVPSQLKNAPMSYLRLRDCLLADGDLLISRSNTRELVALAGIFQSQSAPCFYPDLMMRLRPISKLKARFLELCLRHSPVRRQLTAKASGTSGSMVKVNAADVEATIIAFPEPDEQHAIISKFDDFTSRLVHERGMLSKLRALKVGLADDLLTGNVRVTTPRSVPA